MAVTVGMKEKSCEIQTQSGPERYLPIAEPPPALWERHTHLSSHTGQSSWRSWCEMRQMADGDKNKTNFMKCWKSGQK